MAARQLYGGSINQFSQGVQKVRLAGEVGRCDRPGHRSKPRLRPKTKAIFVESIANPGGIITDIEGVATVAHDAGVPLIVDNTLASPYLMRPIEWGADIVMHSATKFLGGHGNSMGGVIVDGGKFDWWQRQFPTLSEPCASYHGMSCGRPWRHGLRHRLPRAAACAIWVRRSRR